MRWNCTQGKSTKKNVGKSFIEYKYRRNQLNETVHTLIENLIKEDTKHEFLINEIFKNNFRLLSKIGIYITVE